MFCIAKDANYNYNLNYKNNFNYNLNLNFNFNANQNLWKTSPLRAEPVDNFSLFPFSAAANYFHFFADFS